LARNKREKRKRSYYYMSFEELFILF
jgi:hypothetical protein